jgi:N-acetylmuramoyl-L-alanine amidase
LRRSSISIKDSCRALIFIFTLIIPVSADVAVRKIPGGQTAVIPSFERDSIVWVSITDFAEQAGFRHSASVLSRKLTFTNERGKISFIQDNMFYTVDTTVAIAPFTPVRRGALLYFPVASLVRIFGPKHPGTLSWDARASAVTVNALKHTILSVSGEVRQNGTVVSIVLADSLMYNYTYVHPNLAINFNNGKVDPNAIRRTLRSGLIDSAFTVQYDNSAQVSFILNRAIEAPHIDFNRASRTLTLSLKPRVEQQRAAAPPRQPPRDDIPTIRTIVIDPGHGGRDPGAVGPTGVLEKNVVLGIALELKKMLEREGFTVHMTRDRDVFVPLIDRTRFANDKRADLFISIHANAIDGPRSRRDALRGYKIYFLSQAKNEADKLAAMRENAVIELEDRENRRNYDALQDMLNSIAGAEYLRESQELSILMEQTFASNLRQIPRQHTGVGQANFWVLNGAYMPSVLVETGFISNTAEERLLSDRRVQFQIATALSASIVKFKNQFETGQ